MTRANITRKIASSLLTIMCVGTLLCGCSSKPDGADEARNIAENDLPMKGPFKVTDFVRENGWESGNNYSVRFNYNIVPVADYEHMWALALPALALTDEFKGKTAAQILQNVDLTNYQYQIAKDQGRKTLERVANYPGLELALKAFHLVYNHSDFELFSVEVLNINFNLIGFKIGMKAGDKIPRTVTLTYVKTEKGWVRTN